MLWAIEFHFLIQIVAINLYLKLNTLKKNIKHGRLFSRSSKVYMRPMHVLNTAIT